MDEPVRLDKTPVHLGKDAGGNSVAIPLQQFGFKPEDFESYLNHYCKEDSGLLVMQETSDANWSHWESHPAGHELVIVISGSGTFFQKLNGRIIEMPVRAGDVVINPPGVWHTADIRETLTAIYITPCPDTCHEPRVQT
ncbi:MAG: cupin domain-containing protein [Gammaproteobacteria bacterium]|jgi:mannose-6-phosphate isomerase-like protein (cupin superfamily)